jgi:hypothetical protein
VVAGLASKAAAAETAEAVQAAHAVRAAQAAQAAAAENAMVPEAENATVLEAPRPDAAPAGRPRASGRRPWRLAGVLPWGREGGGWSVPAWAPAAAMALLLVSMAVAFQAGSYLQADASTAFLPLDAAVRGDGGTPRIEPRGDLLRLWLEIDDRYGAYRADLYRGDDDEYLLRGEPLRVEAHESTTAVALSLPTELLPPGDYHVLLYGLSGGDAPFVARFDFAIDR